MFQNEVLVECDNDQGLVQSVLGLRIELDHHPGRMAVCQRLRGLTIPTRAMVDQDPDTPHPSYLLSLGKPRFFAERDLALLKDRKRGHLVVIVCPRVEDWVLATAAAADVNPEEFGLPSTPGQFKHAAHDNPVRYAMLLKKLKPTARMNILRELLRGKVEPSTRESRPKRGNRRKRS